MTTIPQLSEYNMPVLAQTLVSLPWEDCPISLALNNVLGRGLKTAAIRWARLGYIFGDFRKWYSIEDLDIPCGITIDRDEAGRRVTRQLLRLSLRFRELRVPYGKDITEFYLNGGDVYAWVEEALL